MGLRKGWGWHCWEGEAWGCRLEVGAHLYFILHDVILYIWFHAVRLIWRTSMHVLKHFKYIDNYFFLYFVVWGVASWSDFCFTIVHPPGTSEISSNGRWLLILPIYYKEEELHMCNSRVTHVVNGNIFGLLRFFFFFLQFEQFYNGKFNGRKLTWLQHLSTGERTKHALLIWLISITYLPHSIEEGKDI